MGKCYFSNDWLEKDEYKPWLLSDPNNRQNARCSVCNKKIDVSNMGEHALKSHAKGAAHTKGIERIQQAQAKITPVIGDFFTSARKSTASSTQAGQSATETPLKKPLATGDSVLSAEVLHCFNIIERHHSFNSSNNSGAFYKKMFPDSNIAALFACSERKVAYMTTFGIAPYLAELQRKAILAEKNYVLLYDESLNGPLQRKQLDIHVRYWCGNNIVTRYHDSSFLGHSKADDLLEKLRESASPINKHGLLQVSMDGPNVNWKVFDLFQKELSKENSMKLLNVGSCGLHVVHNAFRTGHSATSWNLNNWMSSLYWVFKDSPARREDFMEITNTNLFPLGFCGHRWLENESAIQRAIEVWPAVKLYIKKVKGDKAKEPSNRSFKSLEEFAKDPLLEAKAHVFLSISQELTPFLKIYQTDAPMAPFLAEDLFKMIKSILRRVILPEKLAKVKQPRDLVHLDLKDKENFLIYSKIDIGIATSQVLKQVKASDLQVLEFKTHAKNFIVSLISKLLEKAPIMFPLTQHLSCLNPRLMGSEPQRAASKFKEILCILADSGRVALKECDEIFKRFQNCLDLLSEKNLKEKYQLFNYTVERLDDFLFSNFRPLDVHLWEIVVKPLLLLSHGQATVERGFSYNKEIVCENMHERTLVAQRRIFDFLKVNGGVNNISINKAMLTAAAAGRQNYHHYLDKEKEKQIEEEKNRKRKREADELAELKSKKAKLIQEEKDLLASAGKFADQAESQQNFRLLTQSNDMRHKAKAKSAEAIVVERQIQAKLQELA